jgi:uncharacterized membrane protein YbhN (UPF0104 family)
MPDDSAARRVRLGRRERRLLGVGGTVAIVVVVFVFVLPRIADYRDVWEVVRELGWQEAVVLAAVTILNLVTFAPPWMAGSYTILRSWGFGRAAVGLAVGIAGVWNQLANLAFPIVALALLTNAHQDYPGLRTAAVAGVLVLAVAIAAFAVALSGPGRARWIGDRAARVVSAVKRVFGRKPVAWGGEDLAQFRLRALDLLRRRWHVITVATLAGHLTVFVVLVACLRAVGIDSGAVTLVEAFAAWALVRVLGALPLTPGGLGIVELGLSGALVAFGASNADAVAATLLYRALTVLPTLALGGLAAATWRTHHPGESLESRG